MVSRELWSTARAPIRLCRSDRGVVTTERSGRRASTGAGPAGGRGGWGGRRGGGFCVGFGRGRHRPLISAKRNHRPIGGLVSVCDSVDVAAFRYPTAQGFGSV